MCKKFKRILDITITAAALVALWPVMLLIAAAVYLKMGSPVIFRQERAGFNCKPFMFFKFRTMTDERDEGGQLLPDEYRMTRLGTFLRRSSLDELPQLWNILKGDMSLIGPRPLPVKYLPRYSKEQIRRHDVPQGIVGWAAVNGRNAISWEKKFDLDVWYADNWSLALDAKIFFMAIATVLSGHGINEENQATASEFMGSSVREEKAEK
jgi:lipopolysaccharide/colanic/teichoic acid biosynthesis glycosyltransferase